MPKGKEPKPTLYEMMFILDPELGEDGIERMNNTIRERIAAAGGVIEKDQPWGVRKLAYEIKKRQDGYYHVLEFHAPQSLPASLGAFIRTQPSILRHLTIKVPKAKILQEQRDAVAATKAREQPKPAEARPEVPVQETIQPGAVDRGTAGPSPTRETLSTADEPPEEERPTLQTQAERQSLAEIGQEEVAAATDPEEGTPDAPTTSSPGSTGRRA